MEAEVLSKVRDAVAALWGAAGEGLEWVQADQLGSYCDSSGKRLGGLGWGGGGLNGTNNFESCLGSRISCPRDFCVSRGLEGEGN